MSDGVDIVFWEKRSDIQSEAAMATGEFVVALVGNDMT
jgi:hypothetical protein